MKNNILVIAVSLIAGILLSEAVLWSFFPLEETGRSMVVEVVQSTSIPGLKKHVFYEKNVFGFRTLSICSLKKQPGTIRIICLGHSTTDLPMQNTEDIWPSLLEKELQAIYRPRGINIEIAARGYGGQGVKQSGQWAKGSLLKFQPDIVILLEGINDLCWVGGIKEKAKKITKRTQQNFSAKVFFRRYSQIFRRLEVLEHNFKIKEALRKGGALDWHSQNLPKITREYRHLPYAERPDVDPKRIVEFAKNLHELLEFLKRSDLHVLVLGQPVLWQKQMSDKENNELWFSIPMAASRVRPSTAWLEEQMESYNHVQEGEAGFFHFQYLNLNGKLPKNLKYFIDDCHYTDLGNVKMAEEILPALQQEIESIINNRESLKP